MFSQKEAPEEIQYTLVYTNLRPVNKLILSDEDNDKKKYARELFLIDCVHFAHNNMQQKVL